MRVIHSHDPVPERPVTVDEIKATLIRLRQEMWEYAELGELSLAHMRESAMDRLLLALAKKLKKDEDT